MKNTFWFFLNFLQRLLDYPQALPHFFIAYNIPVVNITGVTYRDIEIEILIR